MVAATDLGGYYVLKTWIQHNVAKGISYTSASILQYVFSKYWTFEKRKWSLSEMVRYWIGQLGLLAYNVIVNGVILQIWPQEVFLALAVASLTTMVLSFVTKKWWVFKSG